MGVLCSLDDVKIFLTKEDDDADSLLSRLIDGISNRMDMSMPDFAFEALIVGEQQVNIGLNYVNVDLPPILDRSTVTVSEATTALVDADWRLEGAGTIVRIDSNGLRLLFGAREIFIDYTSGYANNAIPAGLEIACIMQVAHQWRLSRPGGNRLGIEGSTPVEGDALSFRDEGWIEPVKDEMRLWGANV